MSLQNQNGRSRKLNRDYLHDADLDGTARIVEKIAKKLPKGTYKPILLLAGMFTNAT
ncbi:hypothetical protein GS504_00190 [Rhodococcus hoagii]|nr:hypothetical protein [Prescottella equi]